MSAPRSQWRDVDGVLLLDKPSGLTSNTALQKARRGFSARKGGHTGTLDPLASGLLPLCFGEATKFAGMLLDADKTYVAHIRFGIRTTTGDAQGDVIERTEANVDETSLCEVLLRFTGEITQIPPMYSALKRDGRPLYEYARAGLELERTPRVVRIERIELLECDHHSAVVRVCCSKGTYIRVLAEDIGAALGVGAHLTGLRRTGTGGFDVAQAHTLEALEALAVGERDALLLPPDRLVQHFPAVALDEQSAQRICHGQAAAVAECGEGIVRLYRERVFLGLGEASAGTIRVRRLLALSAQGLDDA